MEAYKITAELNLKKIIAESREVAQAMNDFADELERIEKKYADPRAEPQAESKDKCENCEYYFNPDSTRCHECKAESEDVPDTNVGNIYVCPCGYGWDKSKVVRHHFCPNCGAKVQG